jgi:glutathione synthase/RimK-type ligase-like ATP-grasp enzyme
MVPKGTAGTRPAAEPRGKILDGEPVPASEDVLSVKRCAFLTTDSLENFVCDDELAYAPLRELGWEVEAVPWRRPGVDWDRFEAVVIRSTWDYQADPEAFLSVLEEIDGSTARLENPLHLVRWNLRKTYLLDLMRRGIEVVPTCCCRDLRFARLLPLFDRFRVDEIVVKPVVGANADDAFRLRRSASRELVREVERRFKDREFLAQPFLDDVLREGEFSLFFFGGEHGHTILKTPQPGDFRVQEEHGGIIRAVRAEPDLLEAARRAMEALPVDPLYARVDLVRSGGRFVVMEFELIEPALYFRMDSGSAERFARIFDARMDVCDVGRV